MDGGQNEEGLGIREYWWRMNEEEKRKLDLRNHWTEVTRRDIERRLLSGLRNLIDENPGRTFLEVRELDDESFYYPDRHKCSSFQNVSSFLEKEAATEYAILQEQGLEPVVLRKAVAGYRSPVDQHCFKYYLCVRLV